MNICRLIPGCLIPLRRYDPLSISMTQTRHFPETGTVFNSTEASDVLVCRHHVSSEVERGVPPIMRQLTLSFWVDLQASWFTQLTGERRVFVCFLAVLKHRNKPRKERLAGQCCSSSLTVCVMTLFLLIWANTEHMLLVRGSQPAKLVLRDDRATASCLLHRLSIPPLKLPFLCSHCWSVH